MTTEFHPGKLYRLKGQRCTDDVEDDGYGCVYAYEVDEDTKRVTPEVRWSLGKKDVFMFVMQGKVMESQGLGGVFLCQAVRVRVDEVDMDWFERAGP